MEFPQLSSSSFSRGNLGMTTDTGRAEERELFTVVICYECMVRKGEKERHLLQTEHYTDNC